MTAVMIGVAALGASASGAGLLSGGGPKAFQPPADGKFTEAQVAQYLETQNDWIDARVKIFDEVGSAKTTQEKAAAAGEIVHRYRECLDQHKISQDEFEWLRRQTMQAWGAAAFLDGSYKDSKAQLEQQLKEIDAKIAAANQEIAAYQDALKGGLRVLSPQDRDAIVKAAKTEADTDRAEAKRREDDTAAVDAEVKRHEADAQAAEDAAANPPSDLTADEKADYIQNKKDEATAARASAKEAKTQEADSKSAEAEALGRADIAAKRAEHPEIPVTEEARDQAKSDNEGAIDNLKRTITRLTAERVDVVKNQKALEETATNMSEGIPAENVTIMRKYAQQYKDEVQRAQSLMRATTRKSS